MSKSATADLDAVALRGPLRGRLRVTENDGQGAVDPKQLALFTRLALVNVLHVAEGNALVVVAGIFEIEGIARQED